MKTNFSKFNLIFSAIPVVLILFILTTTAIPQNKINNNIPEGLTQEQVLGFRDENGSKIIPSEDPQSDAFETMTMTGFGAGDRFGQSVKSAGDVNGDGFGDFIIGAYNNDEAGTNAGRAYIYFGGIIFNTIPDVILSGESAGISFGYPVSTAGDVNGDGYSDVIISALTYQNNTGRVYIFYGGTVMDNTPDVILGAEAIADFFGISVSNAGDVNDDGYADVIVGASQYGNDQGRAYIYYGGSNMNNTADVIMTGESSNNEFGCSVSSAGDVNGDGYSDVVVGARYSLSEQNGRAYIFFGGAAMDNTADVTMTGEAPSNLFGYSVSIAGDVNGDGYSDIVTGASGFSSNTGRAYIYTGSAISIKPILIYVKDVPNDQGGKVYLKWARSGYDIQSNGTITDYLVQRSYPPSGGNFSWENIANVPATYEPFYTYTAATPFDSIVNSSGTLYFRITARTSIPAQFWRSAILSGRSIDNIAPPMVSIFTVTPLMNSVRLDWSRSTAPDFLNYILSRSSSPAIDLDTVIVLATTTDTTFLDTDPPSGVYYYFLVTQDIHGNYSTVATESPNIKLNLTMFIEGFYNEESNSQVSDTIKVYLRNITSPYGIVDSAKGVVSVNGSAVLLFGKAAAGQYYIVTSHRNSLETWSKSGGESFVIGNAVNYDFSNTSSQAFGNNMIQVDATPVRFAVYSGDVNLNGFIDLTDAILINNDASSFASGYISTDLNGSGNTDLSDLVIAYNNTIKFVKVVKP